MPDPEIGKAQCSAWTTGPSGAASRTPASWWTWTATASPAILPDREAGTFAGWLRAPPGVQLICRDRAGVTRWAPARARPAPGRWHMRDDLGDYVKKTVAAHRGCIKDHYA